MSIILAIILGIATFVVSIVFKLAKLLRLTIPIIFIVIVILFFEDWYDENTIFAHLLLGVLTGAVIVSWIISIGRRVQERNIQRRQHELDATINSERLHYVKVKKNG